MLDSNLKETAALHPLGLQINLQTPGVSTATLTLSPNDAEPGMHDWIEIYNQNGSVGVYRVTNPVTDFNQQLTLTLRHGIDCLADSVLESQEDYKGAPAALLTRLLNAQKTLVNGVKPWALGTCAATDDIEVNINYPRLSELLNNIEEQLEGYLIVYDQTVFPWVLNVIEKPSAVDAEFRLNRNVQTLSRTLNDNEMCTQLILSINSKTVKAGVTGTDTIVKTYNNTAAQQRWGIIQKTADIDTSDTLTGDNVTTPEADAWAARFLADHADPAVQIQITGQELSRITGDRWDETRLGHICRVAVPKYGQSFDERIVAITYPDALGQPDSVTVSLANQLPKFSSAIASLKKEAARSARAGRAAARSAANANEMQVWSQTVQYYGLALDGTGVLTLYESGIDMNPVGGVTIYSLEEGLQALYSGIQVNTNAITAEVNRATAAEGALSGRITIEAGKITQIVQAVGTNGEVTAASIVAAVNNAGSSVVINADKIDLQGYVTTTELSTAIAAIDTIVGDLQVNGALTVGGNVYVDAITLQNQRFTNLIKSASVSGNTLTLTPLIGEPITFNKAASTNLVSGSWSGNIYTVAADENGQGLPIQVSPTVKLSGNGSSANFTAEMVTFEGGSATPTVRASTPGYLVKTTSAVNVCTSSDGTGVIATIPVSSGGGGDGTITAITQYQTAEYTERTMSYTIYARASGTNLTNTGGYYDQPLTITATAAYNQGYQVGVSSTTAYQEGFADGEGQFTQASVTTQGRYLGTYNLRSSSGAIRIVAGSSVKVCGSVHYYLRHTASETPTGVWYTRSTSRPSSGVYNTEYQDGGNASGYVASSSGTYYYLSGGTSPVCYAAGETDTTTYYTKN